MEQCSKTKEKGLKKMLRQSAIKAGSEVNSFVADYTLHPESEKIYRLLGNLNIDMRNEDYSSNSRSYLQGIE